MPDEDIYSFWKEILEIQVRISTKAIEDYYAYRNSEITIEELCHKHLELYKQVVTKRQVAVMYGLTAIVTVAFYFILKALGTANLFLSTVSIATSFLASYLTLMRSSYYAVGYMANDIVLIVLWVLAATADIKYLPMIICFVLFLINDLYGFLNWQKMKKRQTAYESA